MDLGVTLITFASLMGVLGWFFGCFLGAMAFRDWAVGRGGFWDEASGIIATFIFCCGICAPIAVVVGIVNA